ncbi:hypothetical protein EDD17DRAFT_1471255, partial [Pisolithus thermaeus]
KVITNDLLGRKIRAECSPDGTIGELKELIGAQIGIDRKNIQLKKWYTIYKVHFTLGYYEIHNGVSPQLFTRPDDSHDVVSSV